MKIKGLLTSCFIGFLSLSGAYAGQAGSEPQSLPFDIMLSVGGYLSDQGKNQHINIDGLIGNNYTVTSNTDGNVIVGAGLYKTLPNWYDIGFGVNVFYLAETKVKGLIYQEGLFDNLGYTYKVEHLPVMFIAKKELPLPLVDSNKKLIVDAGIGPNVMWTKNYRENSRDGGITLPDNAFTNKTQTEFAATFGVAISVENLLQGNNLLNNRFINDSSIQLGYRFFYLGEGEFDTNNTAVLNHLQTGANYAHSIMLSVTI